MMAAACGGILRQLRRLAPRCSRNRGEGSEATGVPEWARIPYGFGTEMDFQNCILPEQDQSETEGYVYKVCGARHHAGILSHESAFGSRKEYRAFAVR